LRSDAPAFDARRRAHRVGLRRCLYPALCSARSCRAKATTIARSVDAGGRPIKQYELCDMHADVVADRERAKGLKIINV